MAHAWTATRTPRRAPLWHGWPADARRTRLVAAAVAAVVAVTALLVLTTRDDAGAARHALGDYLTALRHGDARAACDAMTARSRGDLAQVGSQLLLTGRASCPAALGRILRSGAGARLRGLAAVPLRRVERRGDVVRAWLAGRETPLVVRRDHGEWRVAGDAVAAAGLFSS